jgi:anti-sigma factor (TIGR02949 family)
MRDCNDYDTNIQLYFGEEASSKDLEEFRVHCEGCAVCRRAIDAEENISWRLKNSRPLYSAPATLHDRVRRAVFMEFWHRLE